MIVSRLRFTSTCPMLQGRALPPKPDNITHEEWDKQEWKKRAHIRDGKVLIPGGAIRLCLAATAKFLSIKKKGVATWTKHFERGVIVPNPVVLDVTEDDLCCLPIYVPAEGKSGGGTRVWRNFPVINQWSGEADVYVFDTSIPKGVFTKVAENMGIFSGLGAMRVGSGGEGGMFDTEVLSWEDQNPE